MSEAYSIFLYRKDNGAFSGAQLSTLLYDTETYDSTLIEPPAVSVKEDEWWIPINHAYWTGDGWELRPVEE
jgi:hypothetical protein